MFVRVGTPPFNVLRYGPLSEPRVYARGVIITINKIVDV